MVKKSSRLQFIVDLNAEKEKEALELLADCQQKKKQNQQQLDNLKNYYQEYHGRFDDHSHKGLNINQLMEFKAFLSKLESAIEDQQQGLGLLNAEIDRLTVNWQMKRYKTQSLQKVCDSARKEEARAKDLLEQKEQDERSARMSRNSGIKNA